MHALRSEEEEQRWRCGGAKTISPLSMRVCVCLNFEDNDAKRQTRLWNQVSQRELENLWNQVKKKKREREKKMREPESFWNQVEVKKKKVRELLESSGNKEKGEDVLMLYVCGGQNAREKRKEKGNCGAREFVTLAHFTLGPKARAEEGYSREHTMKVQIALRHSRG